MTPLGWAYGYEPETGRLQTTGEWSLATDALGRLTQASQGWTLGQDPAGNPATQGGTPLVAQLKHDGFGNNTSASHSGPAVASTLNAFNLPSPLEANRLPAAGLSAAHNPFGELTSLPSGTPARPFLDLAWDPMGRLGAVSLSGGNGGLETQLYSPSGMRVARVDSQDPAQSRAYAYGLKGQLLTEFAGGGGAPHWNRDVIYLGGRAIAEIDGRGVHELHWDHLGTPRLITSGSTGLAEGTQTFGPYGERLASSGYLPLTGYTGHLQEEPNGLIYMKGRFYSPAWHRFLNSDQGVDPQSLNQYAYCGGNPMVCVDPIGLGLLGDLWGGILSLFGAGGGEEGKGKGGGGSLPPLDGFGKFGGGGGGGDGRHRQEPSVDWGALITRNAQGGDLLTIGDYEVSTDEKGGIGWFLPLSLQPGAIVDISENGEAQIDQTGQKPSFGDYFERRWSAPRVYA